MLARLVCAAAACAVLGADPAAAAPGGLDLSFGERGAIFDGGCGTCAVAVDADGGVVLARTLGDSRFDLIRYRRNGSRDPRFGDGDGLASDPAYQEGMTAMALQPDGGTVVAFSHLNASNGAVAEVRRYDRQGRRDPTFGDGGSVLLRGSEESLDVDALAVRPDGGIVVAGGTELRAPFSGDAPPPEFFRLTVWAFKRDGSPDTSFAGGRADVPRLASFGRSMVSQPDGGVVVSVAAENRERLVRLRADGALDEGFGAGGQSGRSVRDDDARLSRLAVQADGKVVALRRYEVARYLPDGRLDRRFGVRGVASLIARQRPDRSVEGTDLAIAPDGRILVAGAGSARRPGGGYDESYGAARLLASGCRDASFGKRGIAVGRKMSGSQRSAFVTDDVAVQSGGRFVLAGAGYIDPRRAPMVIRLQGGGRGRCARG